MSTLLWRPGLELPPKDPADELLIEIQWEDRLGSSSIATATVTAQTGLTASVDSNDATRQVLRLAGGQDGEFYRVTAVIDSADGQHFERSFMLPVAEL